MIKAKLVEVSPIGARVIKFTNGNDSCLTMQRTITSTEINYNTHLKSAKIPIPSYPDCNFFECRKKYDSLSKLRELYTGDSNVFLTHKRELRFYVLKNKGKITIFRPILPFNEKPIWKDVRTLIDLAIFAEFDFVAIPDSFYFNKDEYEKLILASREYTEEMEKIGIHKVNVMPSVDVDNFIELFKSKLNLIKINDFPILNLENKYFISHWQQYDFLRDFSKKAESISIYGSNIPRTHRIDWRTSGLHLHAIFGQDILSQQMYDGFIPRDNMESVHDNPKSKIKIFDKNQDAVLKRGEYNQTYGEELHFENNPYTHGENLTSFFNKFDAQMLAKIIKITENLESAKAFNQEREAILKSEYPQLMKSKGRIGQIIQNCCQTTLPKFTRQSI